MFLSVVLKFDLNKHFSKSWWLVARWCLWGARSPSPARRLTCRSRGSGVTNWGHRWRHQPGTPGRGLCPSALALGALTRCWEEMGGVAVTREGSKTPRLPRCHHEHCQGGGAGGLALPGGAGAQGGSHPPFTSTSASRWPLPPHGRAGQRCGRK